MPQGCELAKQPSKLDFRRLFQREPSGRELTKQSSKFDFRFDDVELAQKCLNSDCFRECKISKNSQKRVTGFNLCQQFSACVFSPAVGESVS